MTTAKVQISVTLLEKLAGIKKEPPQKQQQQQQHKPLGLPLNFGLPVVQRPPAHLQADTSLQQSIQQSNRVGELLLKSEEQEVAAVRQRADELIAQYSAVTQPAPCLMEQQACIDCYKQNPNDVLQCAQLVDAYTTCAQQAAGQLMS